MRRIAIHSAPRSGSSWLGSVFDSHPSVKYRFQPLFSYALKGRLKAHSDIEDIDSFFSELGEIEDEFMDQLEGKRNKTIPIFSKTNFDTIVYKEVRYHHILKNLLIKDNGIKIIGVVRNPLNVLLSWQKAPKEFRADLNWEIEKEWRFAQKKNLDRIEEFNGYEKWKEVAFLFLELKNKFPSRFYLTQYDQLIENPEREIGKLFKFCDLSMTEQTLEFIRESTSRNDQDPYSVFKQKGLDDAWKNELPEYIIQEIKKDPQFEVLNNTFHWL